MFKWIEKQGGVEGTCRFNEFATACSLLPHRLLLSGLNTTNAKKAALLYDYIDAAPAFYQSIVEKQFRYFSNLSLTS